MSTLTDRLAQSSVADPSGCLLWVGQIDRAGYGRVWFGGRLYAHRAAWTAAHGAIPQGLFVCHRCDVRSCVNADHLFLGTVADNNADCGAKGRRRGAPGERNPTATLTVTLVRTVRALAALGWSGRAIADLIDSPPNTVFAVIARKSWRHVDPSEVR